MKRPQIQFKDGNERMLVNWHEESLLNLSVDGFTNGVFNDPNKTGRGYKLINVLDMYIDSTIDEKRLSLVELSDAEFKKNKVESGEIFFTRSSLVKEGIAYSNVYLGHSQDITFDGHLIRMRPKKNVINSIFLNYLLRTSKVRKQLVARGKTATMTTIGQQDIAAVIVAFPPLSEQTKIANFLTAIDEKITHLTQKHTLLTQYKKGVMQQIFSQQLRFKDDDGRDFPEWEETSIGELGKFIGGGTPNTQNADFWEGDIPWVSSSDLSDENIYKISTTRFISHKAISQSATKLVPKNSILIVSRVGVGKVAITDQEICTSQDFTNLVLHAGNPVFFAYLIKINTNKLIEFNQGTSIKGFVKSDLEALKIHIPTIPEQTKIANFLTVIDDKLTAVQTQLHAMKQYKQGLLQQMFV